MNSQITKHSNLFAYKLRDFVSKSKGPLQGDSQPKDGKILEQHSHESVRDIVLQDYIRMDVHKSPKFKFLDIDSILDQNDQSDRIKSQIKHYTV